MTSVKVYMLYAADAPMKPDATWMTEGVDGMLTVRWKAPYDSGSPILQYSLLARYFGHYGDCSHCMIFKIKCQKSDSLRWLSIFIFANKGGNVLRFVTGLCNV